MNPPQAAGRLAYRPEIDGLRGAAVLAVVLYHARMPGAGGGFIGVDIFFAISGFLIARTISQEIDAGGFSLARFYERRARRLLPSLFCVLGFVSVTGWWLVQPADRSETYQSIAFAALFVSNLFFMSRAGYFDSHVDMKPLLHTWSLGIEEQYYLLFPLLLVLLWRKRRMLLQVVLLLLAGTSLAWAQVAMALDPQAVFYVLPTRIWELLAGALCAFVPAREGTFQPRWSSFLAAIGGALIVVPLFLYGPQTPFPAAFALPPVAGTCLLLLFAHRSSFVGRVLSYRPLVGLGLVSYGTYLWHQPFLALARHQSATSPSAPILGLLVAASVGVAWLLWALVDEPVRRGRLLKGRRIWLASSAGILLFTAIGLTGDRAARPEHFTPPAHLPADYFRRAQDIDVDKKPLSRCPTNPHCASERSSLKDASILLFGDSHAVDLRRQYGQWISFTSASGTEALFGGCAMLASQTSRADGRCAASRLGVENLVRERKFSEILVAANLPSYTDSLPAEQRQADIDSFSRLIAEMLASGAKVTFFLPRPQLSREPIKAALQDRLQELETAELSPANRDAWSAAFAHWKSLGVILFDQENVLRRASRPRFDAHTSDLYPLYRDTTHLSPLGARIVFDAYLDWRATQPTARAPS